MSTTGAENVMLTLAINRAHRQGMVSLLGCPGLLSRDAHSMVSHWHEQDVFAKHGLSDDAQLMGSAWCVRLVNARRAVEKAIDTASVKVQWQYHFAFVIPPTLPPAGATRELVR